VYKFRIISKLVFCKSRVASHGLVAGRICWCSI